GVTSASKIVFTAKWSPPNTTAALGSYTSQLFVELKDATSTLQSSVVSYKIITGPVVSISGPTTVNEASSTAIYIIKVSPVSTSTTVQVEYKTVDGTAVAGQDFTGHATTTKTLNVGQATTSVTVLIINDSNKESDETFSVVLVSTNFGTLDTRPAVSDEDVEACAKEALDPFERRDGENPFGIHEDLRKMMQENVGIVRTEEDLKKALTELEGLRERTSRVGITGNHQFNPGWHLALDLINMLDISEAVTRAALMREESRGGHTREDFPDTDDEKWGKVNLIVRKVGDAIEVSERALPEMPDELKQLIKED
ncbi:MAG: hypothetical protein IIB38_08410, partial [Candidatus Hydrogenedentes bacterium]|nr:hypothetical protein [Candidatus Hydrogenedentota bacterium]